jgi:dTDP-4-amino-4,6-dideoxygalactose transaminase
MTVKLFKPFISEESKKLCMDVLNSDQIAEGSVVKQFENEFGNLLGFKNVVAVNSGTSALELAYQLAGIKKDDEVITPVLTCTATNIPLIRLGAKIVFADIDTDLNISIEDVKKKITTRTKAIVFVHFGGNSRGLKELLHICNEHKITLIEDAAQAVGNGFFGVGDFTCVSLQAIKTITSGDGGFLICKSEDDSGRARRLRWFGYDRELKQKLGDTDLTEAGYKYHMNNISAAIGIGNLHMLPKIIEDRKKIAEIYKSYGLFAHTWLAGGFTDHYNDGFNSLKKRMETAGYEIGQHHYRNDKYTLFKKFKNDCPMMDGLDGKYFFVPFHSHVTEEDAHSIGKICKMYNADGTVQRN